MASFLAYYAEEGCFFSLVYTHDDDLAWSFFFFLSFSFVYGMHFYEGWGGALGFGGKGGGNVLYDGEGAAVFWGLSRGVDEEEVGRVER